MSIIIGDIALADPVILAPMSGVTDLPFRKLVKKWGAGLVVSEMVASRAMIIETRQSLQKCAIMHDDATGACVQLAGCEPNTIAEAAKMNEDMGAKIIDLNCHDVVSLFPDITKTYVCPFKGDLATQNP